MKKLMIALAVISAAIVSQAATINWASGTFKNPVSDGAGGFSGWGTETVTSGSVAGYMFALADSAAYNALYNADGATVSANVYNAYKGNLDSATASKSTGTTMSLGDGLNVYGAGSSQYVALLYILTYEDKQYYIGNVGSVTLATASNKTVANMATKVNGSGAALPGWTAAAVPEPTSGLMMLLGVGLMALRRRRA